MSSQPLLRILIVDDNRDLADSMSDILEDIGHFVKVAYRGETAIALFEKFDFDVCFLDIRLPDMNGFDLFYQFHHQDAEVTMIMMTGYRIEQLVAKMLNTDTNVAILQKHDSLTTKLKTLSSIEEENIILVADNSTNIASQIRDTLSGRQVRSHISTTSNEAIDACSHGLFDALILDMGKPIVCALGVYLNIEKYSTTLPTVIIAPERDLPHSSNPLNEINITGCLFKPFDPEAIIEAIEQLALLHCDSKNIQISSNND